MRTTISIDNDLFSQLQGYLKLHQNILPKGKGKRRGSLSSTISSCVAMGLPFLMERLPKIPSESLADSLERRVRDLSMHAERENNVIEAIAIRKEAFQLEDDIRAAFLSKVISSEAYFAHCSSLAKIISKEIMI